MANHAGMGLAFMGVADEYGAVKTWDIPSGSPEFTEVTGIHRTSETTAQVQFSYKFKPNDLCQKMLAAALADKLYGESIWKHQLGGTAQLTLFDDGWRVSSMPNL